MESLSAKIETVGDKNMKIVGIFQDFTIGKS